MMRVHAMQMLYSAGTCVLILACSDAKDTQHTCQASGPVRCFALILRYIYTTGLHIQPRGKWLDLFRLFVDWPRLRQTHWQMVTYGVAEGGRAFRSNHTHRHQQCAMRDQ